MIRGGKRSASTRSSGSRAKATQAKQTQRFYLRGSQLSKPRGENVRLDATMFRDDSPPLPWPYGFTQ